MLSPAPPSPQTSLRAQSVGGFFVQVPSNRHRLCLQSFWNGCWELRVAWQTKKPGLKTGQRLNNAVGPQPPNPVTGQSDPAATTTEENPAPLLCISCLLKGWGKLVIGGIMIVRLHLSSQEQKNKYGASLSMAFSQGSSGTTLSLRQGLVP